jgi:hypothetical protein
MAKLIKLANSEKTFVKMSSKEWFSIGADNDLFRLESDGIVKIAADYSEDLNKYFKDLKNPEIQKALKDSGFGIHKWPSGKLDIADSEGRILNSYNGMKLVRDLTFRPAGAGAGAGDAAAALAGTAAMAIPSGGGVSPPVKVPDSTTGANAVAGGAANTGANAAAGGAANTGRFSKFKNPANIRKGIGIGAAGLAGGLAGYYGTEALSNLFKDNNSIKQYKPDEFAKGVYYFQEVLSPIAGISKALSKEIQAALASIGELQGEFTRRAPGQMAPSLKRREEVAKAMGSGINSPSQGASNVDYLPQ